MNIDKLDRELLRLVQADGRLTNAELAQRIGLSPSAAFRRLQRLEQSGVISGYSATLDGEAIGKPTTVFIEVTLASQVSTALDAFERAVSACEDVLECHLMSGDFDYLIKARIPEMNAYRRLLGDMLLGLPGARESKSYVVMEEIKESLALALED
jgi:Lrp/AsnC family leucine-responsive transcriptional regulator